MEKIIVALFRGLLLFNFSKHSSAKTLTQNLGDVIDLSHFGSRIFGSPVENDQNNFNGFRGNAEEQGPYLEGDLLIPTDAKNGMKLESLRWKNGEVPFEIRGSFSE